MEIASHGKRRNYTNISLIFFFLIFPIEIFNLRHSLHILRNILIHLNCNWRHSRSFHPKYQDERSYRVIDCYRIVKSRIKFLDRGRVHPANCIVPSRVHFIHRFSKSFRRCVSMRVWIFEMSVMNTLCWGLVLWQIITEFVLRGDLWDRR